MQLNNPPKERTFLNWIAIGSKFAAVASGGKYDHFLLLQSDLTFETRFDIHSNPYCTGKHASHSGWEHRRFCLATCKHVAPS